MELKARSIKLFCAVVETSQLEDRLGCRLFDRSTKNLTLTEDGKAFYRVAKESMRAWHMLEDFPKQRASTKKQLRIAVLARHCSNVIIPAVAKILKAHEETLRITMDVHQSRSKFSHPFDVGFGTLLSSHDDLQKEAIAHLPFRLVVPKTNPMSRMEKVRLEDYAHENFILLSADKLEREYIRSLHPALTPDRIVAELSSTQVALRFVKRGIGVHITDELAAMSVSDDCAAVPLENPLTIPFYVFWPVTSESLWPEIRQCIAEIAGSIRAAGIPLTEAGESYLKA